MGGFGWGQDKHFFSFFIEVKIATNAKFLVEVIFVKILEATLPIFNPLPQVSIDFLEFPNFCLVRPPAVRLLREAPDQAYQQH